MTNDELYLLLRNIVMLVTSVPTAIKAFQSRPSPSGEYASIFVKPGRKPYGQAIIRRTNTALVTSPIGQVHDVNHDIRPQVVAQASVNFYRGDAHEYASRLFEANKRPDVSALLFNAGVGWQKTGPVNDLTTLQSNQSEPRAEIELFLMLEQTQSATSNAIYSATIAAEDEGGNQLQTETQTAPAGV